MQTLNHSELLTKSEAAALLKVSTATIERWVRDEKIPSIKIGRTVRFDKSSLFSAGNNTHVPA